MAISSVRCRSALSLSSFAAILEARKGSSVANSSTTSRAVSMRPAALIRGATRKAIEPALGGLADENPATSRRAFRPKLRGLRNPSRPNLTKIRFSPTKGTTSAMVPIATSFRNETTTRVSFSCGQPNSKRRA